MCILKLHELILGEVYFRGKNQIKNCMGLYAGEGGRGGINGFSGFYGILYKIKQ